MGCSGTTSQQENTILLWITTRAWLRLLFPLAHRPDPPASPCNQQTRVQCRTNSLPRSEEHTSELQSHLNLVCRLLLEKKKKYYDEICIEELSKCRTAYSC